MTTPEISTAKPAVDPEKDAKRVAAKKTKDLYSDVVPLAAGLFDKNTRLSKEKMIATLHRSVLGLTKNKEARPIEDLKLFLAVANQYGLNPFKKEIYAVYMWDSSRGRDELTPIVSIHGLRKMARAGGVYTHTGAAIITYDQETKLPESVTVPVFGRFPGETTPHEVTRYQAFYEEFVKTNKEGKPTGNWKTMPRVMLTKCAEANALRAGFDIAGIYVEEELTSNNVIEGETVDGE